MKRYIPLLLALCLLLCGCAVGNAQSAAGAESENAPAENAAAAEAPETEEDVTLRIGALTGPTAMGLARLFQLADAGESAGTYEYTLAGSADELTPLLIQGKLDAAAIPINLAAVLHGKTEGALSLACVNTLGVLYVVEKGGETVQSLADLRGKTLYATGKGSTPEYTLRYLLAQWGLDADTDVNILWMSEPTEAVARMNAEEHALAMLPQPYVTVALGALGEGSRVALSLNDCWAELENGSLLVTAGLVLRRDFVEAHPEAVETFLREYSQSVAWVNANTTQAARACEELGIVKAAVAQKALPECNLVFLSGAEMKNAAQGFLSVLYEQNSAAVGGALPGDDFYYGVS